MPNPLFNALGGAKSQMPGPLGRIQNLKQEFEQFRANFQGDPRQKVQELLNSGQMTQQQYNQLQGMAQNVKQMLDL